MKNFKPLFALIAFISLSCVAFSQEEIDQRLVINKGKQAEDAFKFNRNSYNYYLFELDSAYQVVKIKDLTKEEKGLLNKNIVFSPETIATIGTSSFNYYQLGIRPNKETRQYFKIDSENVLVIFKISEITKAFSTSPLYTK
ncbi:MAG: hypothetical protein IT221_07060 [Fluviicola sp.]|nr:hypothetical protein [Fluviicola sp.]